MVTLNQKFNTNSKSNSIDDRTCSSYSQSSYVSYSSAKNVINQQIYNQQNNSSHSILSSAHGSGVGRTNGRTNGQLQPAQPVYIPIYVQAPNENSICETCGSQKSNDYARLVGIANSKSSSSIGGSGSNYHPHPGYERVSFNNSAHSFNTSQTTSTSKSSKSSNNKSKNNFTSNYAVMPNRNDVMRESRSHSASDGKKYQPIKKKDNRPRSCPQQRQRLEVMSVSCSGFKGLKKIFKLK